MMQLSKLIEHLQSLLDEEGDMPVMVKSAMQGGELSGVRHLIHWGNPQSGDPYAEIG
jgi:hypothetical protein